MKKIVNLVIALMMITSMVGCGTSDKIVTSNETTSTSAEMDITDSQEVDTNSESILQPAVDAGIITAEEAVTLMAYLEANDPNNGGTESSEGSSSGEPADPFTSAAAEGIITSEQALALAELIQLGPNAMSSDTSGGPSNGAVASTYTVEEAKAIEEKLVAAVGYSPAVGGYPIVDTNQTLFFSNDAIIDAPALGEDFYGQDASFVGNAQSYTDNGDGTVTDNVTGLVWQQDPGDKMTWPEAVAYLDEFNAAGLGGYSDWRIPTIKELYSLTDFSGMTRMSSDTSIPYINTDYFVFTYGDAAGENRFIDSQIMTTSIYNSTTLGGNTTVFGYNFADGRIKGYEIDKDFYCYFVRGNTNYGQNLFVDNGDETITDQATSLMWTQNDSGYYKAGTEADGTLNWQEALEWVADMNDQAFLGYSDWRLPDVKELQSIVDYSKATILTGEAAIDDLFYSTPIINCFDEDDFGYYWSGTTHNDTSASPTEYNAASYVVFGKAMGTMDGEEVDAHGSGSQKSDPKTGIRSDYPAPDENAPQGDEQRVYNMVRLVRDATN